jgi:hypothetical protein
VSYSFCFLCSSSSEQFSGDTFVKVKTKKNKGNENTANKQRVSNVPIFGKLLMMADPFKHTAEIANKYEINNEGFFIDP